MTRLIWRKQNLATFRIAVAAKEHRNRLAAKKYPAEPPCEYPTLFEKSEAQYEYERGMREARRGTEKQARQELADTYLLTEIGEAATIDGLMNELDIKERLDSLIDRCLKRLLMVRGVKSLSIAAPSGPAQPISEPQKTD
jgi:hypothetical protein